jgi:hypothetical protein
MHKALVVKELRESAILVTLAVLASADALADLTATPIVPWQGLRVSMYPFVQDELSFYFWLVGGGFAIALGLRQTAFELAFGTYYFLIHRPVDRSRIFAYKLVIGTALVMPLSAAMVLFYALWAATPGHIPAPFFWSMTAPAWTAWVALPPLYFGAFLSGIRPGKWFGTRLVPLLAAMLVSMVAANMPWFWLAAVMSLTASALLIVDVFFYVQHRDY